MILKENYKYKNEINKNKILKNLKFEYNNIKQLCDILYQSKQRFKCKKYNIIS